MALAYQVRDGFHIPNKEAEVLAAIQQKLATKLGRPITREDLLKEATKPRSPLHRYFQWDDSEAAHQYRLIQAGYLLRALDVTIEERGGQRIRSMVLVTSAGEDAGYVPTATASSEVVRAQLARAYKDAEAFYERYVAWRNFIEFSPMESVMAAMEQVFSKTI